jgi:hypothetical protein
MIRLNRGQLDSKINRAFADTADAYADQCQQELRSDKWNWPGETIRSSGVTVGSPRDIVDTGDLINSQQPTRIQQQGDRTVATIEYSSDHAAVVHEGWADQTIYPGRPWSKTALEELDVVKDFADRLGRTL